MKRIAIVALLLAMLMLAGCKSSHFTVVERNLAYNIVYDNDTKVMYLQGGNGKFEVILNADGTPRIWEE